MLTAIVSIATSQQQPVMLNRIGTLLLFVCAALGGSAAAQTVTITSPASNSTVSAAVTVNATFTNGGTAQYMKLWLDGVAQYFNNGQNTLSYSMSPAAGSHQVVVQAYNGMLYSASVNFVVQGTAPPAVTITSPDANANVGSPVTVNAMFTNGGTAQYMKLWVDGVAQYFDNGKDTLSYAVPLAAGSHEIVVQAYNGNLYSTKKNVNVGSPLNVTISPTSASVQTGQAYQFNATVTGATNTGVAWSASGGTISSSGLYTAPNSGGTYTVKATSLADTTKSASAAVTVTSTQGRNWYVSSSGADGSSCGSSGAPCATINYVNGHMVAPGDTVHVSGSFTLNSTTCISTTTSGTASAPITYIADPAGSAKINGNAACFYMWHNTANYVRIYGFDFTGVQTNTNTDSGTTVILSEGAGGNVDVAYNTVHNLPSGFSAAIVIEPFGSSGYTSAPCSVHDNVFHDLGYNSGVQHGNYAIYVTCGTNSYIYNNLIYNEGSIGIHCWHSANNVHIYNNTIANAQYIGILVGTGDGGAVAGAYFDVSNNIVVNSKYGIMGESGSPGSVSASSVFRDNLIYNNAVDWYYNNNGVDSTLQGGGMAVTGTVIGNPLFVSASAGNFRPAVGSPAFDAGIYVGITHDLDGNPISAATGVNIGAY